MSHQDEVESGDRASEASSRDGAFSDSSHVNDNNGRPSKSVGRKPRPGGIPSFTCTHIIREDHEQHIYDCAFNPYYGDDDDVLFATVGSSKATIYRCTDDGKFKPIYCFTDPNDEVFYSCTWLYDSEAKSYLLAVGGKRGIIQLIAFCGTAGPAALIGHGQAINEVTTHPTDSCLLLSASKDNELRLWNVRNRVCVAIFGGDGGHKSEVLACDFDLLGERIVSGGMDHSIKVWSILDNHRVDKAVQQSRIFLAELNTENFPTVRVTNPDFSTRDVHKNYVDCVRWFGDTLISKSCENTICHWKPGSQRHMDFSKDETNVSLLHKWRLPSCTFWFIKFAIDQQLRMLAAGNQLGKIYIWDLNSSSAPKCLQHSKCTTAVRQAAFSPNGNILIAVCDDSTVWRWTRKRTN